MTLAKVVYLAVVTMCAATIAVVSVGFTKQIQSNRRAVRHLCGLAEITAVVWKSAERSLPARTGRDKALLRALRKGVREIRTDRSCPH